MSAARFRLVSAAHLFLLRGHQVLLLRRFQTGYEDGNYSVIAGHLEGGEQVKAACRREALEEAGIVLEEADLEVVGVMHRRSNDERVDWFLTASRWQGELRNAEPDHCDAMDWFDLDRLPGNMVPYVRRALENFIAGRWFDSFGW